MKVNEIKKILAENATWAKKNYGQHFLVDENILSEIVEAADIQSNDVIVEVGPGLGVLTEKLLEKAGQVFAIEADEFLAGYLEKRFNSNVIASEREAIYQADCHGLRPRNDKNLTLIKGDGLKVLDSMEFKKNVLSKNYKFVANIPYSITSKLLRILLENEYPPTSITCLVQKEVAERIIAKPGSMSLLSLSVQYYGEPKIIAKVPAGAFWPPPKIESAILKISNIKHSQARELPNLEDSSRPASGQTELNKQDKFRIESGMTEGKQVFRIARMGFSSKRKTLVNNLVGGLRIAKEEAIDIIKSVGLNENIRAQELSVEQWQKLANKLPG